MSHILEGLEQWIRQNKRSRILRKIALVMACMVIFTTTYALILPAITIDDKEAHEMPGLYLEDTGLVFGADIPELENEQGDVEELVLEAEFFGGEELEFAVEEETETETETEVETEAETEAETEVETEPETEVETELETEVETEA